MNCTFFKMSDEAMAPAAAGSDVSDEEQVPENTLGDEDKQAEEGTGLVELHEGQEMHTFVGGFIEEAVDPSAIALHETERTKMTKSTSDKSGNTSESFEEDDTTQDLGFGEFAKLVARHDVEPETNKVDGGLCGTITEGFARANVLLDLVNFLVVPDRMVRRKFVVDELAILFVGDGNLGALDGGDVIFESVLVCRVTEVSGVVTKGGSTCSSSDRSNARTATEVRRRDVNTAEHILLVLMIENVFFFLKKIWNKYKLN